MIDKLLCGLTPRQVAWVVATFMFTAIGAFALAVFFRRRNRSKADAV
jgi:uncharacterized protein (DUF3084 family)